MRQTARVLSTLQDAETGQRGYLLTSNTDYLEPYRAANARADQDIDRLAMLARDDAAQERRASELRKVAKAKFDELTETVALVQAGNRPAALANVQAGTGKMLMDKARAILGVIDAEETRLLRLHHAEAASKAKAIAVQVHILTAAGIVTLLAAAVAALAARRATDRLAALKEIAASEQRLQLFVDRAPANIIMLDTEMRYLAVSQRFISDCGLTGETPASLRGRSHYDLFPDLPERWLAIHRRVLAGETLSAQEDEFLRGDGHTEWLNWEMSPWYGSDQSIGGALIFSEDVTTKKNEHIALARSEARLRGLLDAVAEGIILATEDGHIVSVNPAAVRIFGYDDEQEMAGQPLTILMPSQEAERHDAHLAQHRTTGKSRVIGLPGRQLSGVRKDGSVFPMELSVSSFRSGDKRYLTSVLNDLTERQQSEAAVRRAEDLEVLVKVRTRELEETQAQLIQASKIEALGSLTAGMAHDFNNLLGVIVLNLDVAQRLLPDSDRSRKLVVDALASAQRGADLIRSLLAFARRQPLRPARIELGQLVSNMRDLLARTLGEHIDIVCEQAPDLWPVIADAAQVESCLLNIAANARDAMPDSGQLTIITSNQPLDADYARLNPSVTPGDYAMIAVSDTGVGMPADVVAKIFEPFFTTKEQGKGTGLGLSMVYGFAAQSNGHVSVYSEPGVGTTFRLFLPRAPVGPDMEALRPADPLALDQGDSEIILVVEDNAAMREAVVLQLAALNYRILEADSAQAALIALETQKVDLVFSDVVMPGGMDGFELIEQVRARWPSVRVLLTSGFAGDHKGQNRVGSEPPTRLLNKPYDLNQLARAIRGALNTNFKDLTPC